MPTIDTPVISALSRYLDVNAYRQTLTVSNMANIDTPGYRTRDIDFARELQRADTHLEYAVAKPAVHQVRGLVERPDGNNVNVERESLVLAETQLRFRTGVQLLRSEFRRLSVAINEGK
jgi:flagellar basal-body rod protein FlgB